MSFLELDVQATNVQVTINRKYRISIKRFVEIISPTSNQQQQLLSLVSYAAS